jgi:hypothetical protein
MVDLRPSLTLWGERFSPRRAEEAIGLPLARAKEPGEMGLRGRCKGLPLPYGAAFVKVPPNVESAGRLPWLIEWAERHLPAPGASVATLCKLHLDVLYWDQCNLEFDPQQLARIAILGLLFTITCWDRTGTEEPG